MVFYGFSSAFVGVFLWFFNGVRVVFPRFSREFSSDYNIRYPPLGRRILLKC